MIADEKPDLILLAGDLFDRSVPPEDAVKVLDQFLATTILKLKVPVVMIPGNHDSCARVGAGAELLRASGLHVFATAESIETPLQFQASGIRAAVYGIPFLEPAEWNFFFRAKCADVENYVPIRTHAEALAAILKCLEPQLELDRAIGRRTILILHAYVTGGEPTESERPLSIGGSDLVPADLLQNFDYVALGHLHRPQKISSERIRYSGSLFCYSQSEVGQEKGVVIATLNTKSADDDFQFRKFKTSRRLRLVRGTLDDLVAAEMVATESSSQAPPPDLNHDYVIAILTDQSLPFEAFRRLAAVFPGLLHVGRETSWTRADAETADLAVRARARETSDRDVLAQFIAGVSVNELSDEDRDWLLNQLEAFTKSETEVLKA